MNTKREAEPPVPKHVHSFEWEDDAEFDPVLIGIRCQYTYEIPPGLRGRKPRQRQCPEFYDMDEVLAAVNYLSSHTTRELERTIERLFPELEEQ